MEQGKKRGWLRAPSPAMIVALVALVFAMCGTGYAATKLVSGDSLIKKNSLSGNRLRTTTLPGARVRCNTTQSIPTSVSTALTFNTVDANVGGVFKNTQPTRLTAPVAGTYLITASIAWSNNLNGSRTLTLEVNGSTDIAAVDDGPSSADDAPQQSVATTYHLKKGDYVRAVVWQSSGTDQDSWNFNKEAPLFTMNWIAP